MLKPQVLLPQDYNCAFYKNESKFRFSVFFQNISGFGANITVLKTELKDRGKKQHFFPI